jgi:acyl carrier protein
VNPLFDKLSTLLVNKFGRHPDELTPEVTLADLELESLAIVEFAVTASTEFGVTLNEDELSDDQTLGQVVELLGRKGAHL